MVKIITVIPVRNDAWCIENAICSAVKWSDYVFVADDNSDDGSHDIYKRLEVQYKNLNIIYSRPKLDFNTPDLRNYYLELARSIDGSNIIFEMHADEVISAEFLKPGARERFIASMDIGSAVMMPWVNLWKSTFYYRDDQSVWSNNYSWFAFRDDRKVQFKGPVFHGPRAPESFLDNKIIVNFACVMHYQFVNFSMERSKQALYQVFEKNHFPNKNVEYINKIYACAFDERKVKLSKLKEKHFKPWLDMNLKIDMEYSEGQYNWRDTEVLKNFEKYGTYKYKNLNIWYINWEKKRKEAILLKLEGVPSDVIVDPRGLSDKLSHWFLMKYQFYPFWRLNFYKLLGEKVAEKVRNKYL